MIREKSGLPHSMRGLEKFIQVLPTNSTVLDIGAGQEDYSELIRNAGHEVDTVDFFDTSTFTGDYNLLIIPRVYDGIWISHVLEQQLNPNLFLTKVNSNLKEDGWLAITVPPLQNIMVSRNFTLWNGGILLYHLVMAGFNCRYAKVKTYDYNISVVVQKKSIDLSELINGDLRAAAKYLPEHLPARNHKGQFDGHIKEINWEGQ